MSKIKTRGNPVMWKARMLNKVEPQRQSSPVLYSEPYKRFMTKDFDFVTPRGYVEDVEADSMDAFTPILSNESEARTVVALANHQHLRRTTTKMIAAELAYRESLKQFNICGNCLKPIRVKRETFKGGKDVNNLTEKTAEYVDISAHYRVFNHPTKRNKFYYELVPKTRLFNQRCGCGI